MKELRELRKGLEQAIKPGNEPLVDAVFGQLERQVTRCDRLEKENKFLRERIAEFEQRLDPPPPSPAVNEPYSLEAEAKRRQRKARRKKLAGKRKPGRKPKQDKLDCVRWVDILPEGVAKKDCTIVNERPVWHIEDGRAVRVGYRVHRQSWQETPRIPGVLPRCEYAIEIHVLLAYLVYMIGMSIDKACQLLRFFCELPIERSQADAMLTQLGRHWADDFDDICEQLVMAAVVYADETSWRVGRLNSSLWAFTSELHCVMLFGCSKDRETLESILPPEEFEGVLVSDDAAVYQQGYQGQKCWAHLIRKMVKLVLLEPENATYRSFLDELLLLYRSAKRAAQDARLGAEGRARRVSELEAQLCDICHPHWPNTNPQLPQAISDAERSFRNLIQEFMRLMTAEQLFEFVLNEAVEPTNNLSERQLRNSTLAKNAQRTNKADTGAKRQSHIVSVLETFRRTLNDFNIRTVVKQVVDSLHFGIRLFQATGPPQPEAV
jgi:transposase